MLARDQSRASSRVTVLVGMIIFKGKRDAGGSIVGQFADNGGGDQGGRRGVLTLRLYSSVCDMVSVTSSHTKTRAIVRVTSVSVG